jgi:hypothetical protein
MEDHCLRDKQYGDPALEGPERRALVHDARDGLRRAQDNGAVGETWRRRNYPRSPGNSAERRNRNRQRSLPHAHLRVAALDRRRLLHVHFW